MTDLLILGVVLLSAAAAAGVWRWREGRVVKGQGAIDGGVRDSVGIDPGKPALLLFTTPTCGNCDAAREVLATVGAERPSVAVAEVDVATHPGVAREHHVLRAPTVLVVDERDAIRARVSGVPDRAQLRDALTA